jgi:D-alanine-D-alanine ligase
MMPREQLKSKKIGVLYGGLSAERDVSLKSGAAVCENLLSLGYDAQAIDVDRNLARKLADAGIEIAFVALHGRYGEDGAVQGLLEMMGIPYTGSGVLASALAMNKIFAKAAFQSAGLLVAPYRVLRPASQFGNTSIPLSGGGKAIPGRLIGRRQHRQGSRGNSGRS